jgi:hypothetical protein
VSRRLAPSLFSLLLAIATLPVVASAATEATTAEVVFHYADVAEAARFYREHLGLVPVEEREEAVVLEIAPGARLVLADQAAAGYTDATPRTAALALVTEDVERWWAALSGRDLAFRSRFTAKPDRAHDGFVLVDPGGWFLEFERFHPHPENEALLPRLSATVPRPVDHAAAGLPAGLGFRAAILWLYYRDLEGAERYHRDTLGFAPVVDQGWAKILALGPASYLGLVDGARGMHPWTEEKAVALALRGPGFEALLGDADGPLGAGAGVRDPGGHLLRFRNPSAAEGETP